MTTLAHLQLRFHIVWEEKPEIARPARAAGPRVGSTATTSRRGHGSLVKKARRTRGARDGGSGWRRGARRDHDQDPAAGTRGRVLSDRRRRCACPPHPRRPRASSASSCVHNLPFRLLPRGGPRPARASVELEPDASSNSPPRLIQVDILTLKGMIEPVCGVPAATQRLLHRGRVLKDDQRVSNARLADGDTILLVQRPPDAPAATEGAAQGVGVGTGNANANANANADAAQPGAHGPGSHPAAAPRAPRRSRRWSTRCSAAAATARRLANDFSSLGEGGNVTFELTMVQAEARRRSGVAGAPGARDRRRDPRERMHRRRRRKSAAAARPAARAGASGDLPGTRAAPYTNPVDVITAHVESMRRLATELERERGTAVDAAASGDWDRRLCRRTRPRRRPSRLGRRRRTMNRRTRACTRGSSATRWVQPITGVRFKSVGDTHYDLCKDVPRRGRGDPAAGAVRGPRAAAARPRPAADVRAGVVRGGEGAREGEAAARRPSSEPRPPPPPPPRRSRPPDKRARRQPPAASTPTVQVVRRVPPVVTVTDLADLLSDSADVVATGRARAVAATAPDGRDVEARRRGRRARRARARPSTVHRGGAGGYAADADDAALGRVADDGAGAADFACRHGAASAPPFMSNFARQHERRAAAAAAAAAGGRWRRRRRSHPRARRCRVFLAPPLMYRSLARAASRSHSAVYRATLHPAGGPAQHARRAAARVLRRRSGQRR